MNDPMLAASNLENLLQLAKSASTPFEKASVFSATHTIANQFEEYANKDGYLLEKVTKARWHISAIVGYDITNGHSLDQHIVWATGAINTLKDVIKENS